MEVITSSDRTLSPATVLNEQRTASALDEIKDGEATRSVHFYPLSTISEQRLKQKGRKPKFPYTLDEVVVSASLPL